jgi:hypothetical protein
MPIQLGLGYGLEVYARVANLRRASGPGLEQGLR